MKLSLEDQLMALLAIKLGFDCGLKRHQIYLRMSDYFDGDVSVLWDSLTTMPITYLPNRTNLWSDLHWTGFFDEGVMLILSMPDPGVERTLMSSIDHALEYLRILIISSK